MTQLKSNSLIKKWKRSLSLSQRCSERSRFGPRRESLKRSFWTQTLITLPSLSKVAQKVRTFSDKKHWLRSWPNTKNLSTAQLNWKMSRRKSDCLVRKITQSTLCQIRSLESGHAKSYCSTVSIYPL